MATPPGWYADPAGSGWFRWWNGMEWGSEMAPYPQPIPWQAPPARPTDGFAIAALALGIFGAWPLSIIFGVVAKRRIRRSGHEGGGMAMAGIVLGIVWLVLTVYIVLPGIVDHRPQNASRYSGPQHEVAQTIDDFESGLRHGDGGTVCGTFEPRLATYYDATYGSCAGMWGRRYRTDIDIDRITLPGPMAYVVAHDSSGRQWTFYLEELTNGWKIEQIYPPS